MCLIWFDVPHTIFPAQSLELNKLVKRYQPDCLINSRIGNGAYDYVSLGDNEIPQEPPKEALESQNMNDLAGYKFSPNCRRFCMICGSVYKMKRWDSVNGKVRNRNE